MIRQSTIELLKEMRFSAMASELERQHKIHNYILMGQPPKEQNKLYDGYWTTIERCWCTSDMGSCRQL